MKKFKIAVIGASGYTGLELIKLILNHPDFEIGYLATTQGSEKLSKLHPALYGVVEVDIEKVNIDEIGNSCDLAFLAFPHKIGNGWFGKGKAFLKKEGWFNKVGGI